MSEHKQQPPTGQYGTGKPPGEQPPGQPPSGQYPSGDPGQNPPPPTGQYPPTPPQGQYPPPPPPTGQYPPAQPPTGQYPPQPPPGYPPTQPPTGTYPPPTTCPDPCDGDRHWGPPKINPECCPKDRDCCSDANATCTWDEVDDPCVRAASADCGYKSTKISCKCEGGGGDCGCGDWDCGIPDGMCAPCYPCEGLIPEDDPDDGGGGCDDQPPEGCSSDDLRVQQVANKRCITSKQTEKAKLEAEIKARQDRDKELTALISSFDGIVDKYKAERHKLICREDCLKGFYRDTIKVFEDAARFPAGCAGLLQETINRQLCLTEKAKCCQKNLEWKLEKMTRLIWEQKEAEKASKKADDAFAQIKDLPKWMGEQFADLEKLKDQIAQALNDKDPQKHKWAFYLFFWKFAPGLCRRFKVAICCGPVNLGCLPGDWHPSKISEDVLKKLICCAWEYAKTKKEELQKATAAVDTVKQHLDFIKKMVEDDAKTLEDRIKAKIEQVICGGATSTR